MGTMKNYYLTFKDVKQMDLGLTDNEVRKLLKRGKELMKEKNIFIPSEKKLMITNDILKELIKGE
jgi:hypothetical protein